MKFELYESDKKKDGLAEYVMVMAGAGVPDALQCKGVTWTLRVVLDSTTRSRPWAPWVMEAIDDITRDGFAVGAYGVLTEVIAPPSPSVVTMFDRRWHKP